MGDVSELQQAKKWIRDSLIANAYITANVGTDIYASILNIASPAPSRYILYSFLAGTDVDALGTSRLLSKPLFQVLVVSTTSPDAIVRKLDKSIDDVLQNAVHQASGDYFFTARREQPVDRVFTDAASRQYFSVGGLYRLYIGRTV
jgi:hypothetical protein